MFELRDLQLARAKPDQRERAIVASRRSATEIVAMITQVVRVRPGMMGKFIGTGGSNLKSLQEQHPGSHFQKDNNGVVLYARDATVMAALLRSMRKYK